MSATIILDFLSDPMGGLLASACAFLNRVRALDAESRFVVLEVNGALSARVDDAAAFDWVNVASAGGLHGVRRLLWQNGQLPRIAKRYDATVYLSLSHYLPLLPSKVCTIIGVSNLAPFSADAYAVESAWRGRLRLRVLHRTILRACRRADRVVALSEACRAELAARGIDAGKISVIPNGVSRPPQSEAPLPLPEPIRGREFILCVSHFYRYKNYERLVRAYALLADSVRRGRTLLLVGAPYDTGYLEKVRGLIGVLGLASEVEIIPGVYGTALVELYRRCAVFAFPSLIENSPITLLEAMINGAPVAAADIPAMREMGGDAIVYFDPHNEHDLARALEKLLADAPRRELMRRRGMERARAYSWDSFTRRLVQLYRELYAEQIAGPATANSGKEHVR